LFPFCANYGSIVFKRIFKVTISSKGISFGKACEHQEDFSPKRIRDEAISGKVEKIGRRSRETN